MGLALRWAYRHRPEPKTPHGGPVVPAEMWPSAHLLAAFAGRGEGGGRALTGLPLPSVVASGDLGLMSSGTAAGAGLGTGCGERRGRLLVPD